ncbi:MAG TPA: hypothetical protein VMW94_02325, partial [Actinomycetes bacterium]|nr:hypothetical protein [Actinomycetes bacterium]
WRLHQLSGGSQNTAGRPRVYTPAQTGADGRQRITVWPAPGDSQTPANATADPYLVIEYFARQLRPSEPDVQIPYVPQEHIDVLVWGSAAHGLLLDTDPGNAQAVAAVFESKLADLRRENNRKVATRTTVLRSAADVRVPMNSISGPVTRIASLEGFLL